MMMNTGRIGTFGSVKSAMTNNLCCIVNPYIKCYYCGMKWCADHWDEASNTRSWSRCTEGDYPSEGHRGGHYSTYNFDKSFRPDVEKHRFKK